MSAEYDYEEVVNSFVYKELRPIMKNVVFNMSNVTVDEEKINEDFIVNFFKEIRQSMNSQWKEVVKCGLEKYCNDHNLEILSKDDFEKIEQEIIPFYNRLLENEGYWDKIKLIKYIFF